MDHTIEPPTRPLSPRDDVRAPAERPLPTPRPPAGGRSELEDLAPIPEVRDPRLRSGSDDSTGGQSFASISHLPPLPPTFHQDGNVDRDQIGRTSEPSPLQSSIGYSLSKLLSLSSFITFLSSQNGYQDFWEFLLAFSSPHLHTLELQRDLQALIRLTSHSSAAARAMRDVYCTPHGEKKVILKNDSVSNNHDSHHDQDSSKDQDKDREDGAGEGRDFMSDMGHALLEIAEPPSGLERASRHLLQELYQHEFEAFVKHRLLAHTKLQLEKRDLNKNDVAGLGEAFVLSNPKLYDCPIVLASPAFSALTGYTQEEIIGRNCRFLQGESTSPESVNEVRLAIKEQKSITQLLLNYDKSGAPFFNLLCIVPLFSPSGELIYFIGGQTDVTGALGNGNRLALPGRTAFVEPSLSTNSSEIDLSAFSPVVQTFSNYSTSSATAAATGDSGTNGDVRDGAGKKADSIRSVSTHSSSTNAPQAGGEALSAGRHYGSELVDPSHDKAAKSTSLKGGAGAAVDKPARPKPFSRSSAATFNRNSFLGPKSWTLSPTKSSSGEGGEQRQRTASSSSTSSPSSVTGFDSTMIKGQTRSAVDDSPKLEYRQGTVERRIHEFQTTYEKVILVSRTGRKILFNTGAFLRFCGLPASTPEQIDNSILIKTDLLEVVRGPLAANTQGAGRPLMTTLEVRQKIEKAFEEGGPCSVRCGIKVEEKKTMFKTRSAVGHPTAEGVLHLTPMKDINGRTTAYVAIFA